MLAKLREMRDKKMLAEQKMKVVRDQIIEDNIRKGASREMYNEIYKPITEGLESQ